MCFNKYVKLLLGILIIQVFNFEAPAQESKMLIGGGAGSNSNFHKFPFGGINVFTELPLGKSMPLYLNFNGAIGSYPDGGVYFQTHILGSLLVSSYPNQEPYDSWDGYTLGLFLLFPTGLSYYLKDTLTTRVGFYLNPLNSEYFSNSTKNEVMTYAPELGFKYSTRIHLNTYFYFSIGAAYLKAFTDENHYPKNYENGLYTNVCLGIVYFGGPKDKRE